MSITSDYFRTRDCNVVEEEYQKKRLARAFQKHQRLYTTWQHEGLRSTPNRLFTSFANYLPAKDKK